MLEIAKTEETLKLEKQIYNSTIKQGVFGCFEVTIGWYGKERVDFMTYDTKGIFRCYEIKVSKADFHSKAKVSFVGHYNYYVMPSELYEQVKDEIPKEVGVYTGNKGDYYGYRCTCVKKATKQETKVDEQTLKDSMIRSLTRYLDEQMKNDDENYVRLLKRELAEEKRKKDSYCRLWNDLTNLLFKKFGSRYMRIIEDMEDKYS